MKKLYRGIYEYEIVKETPMFYYIQRDGFKDRTRKSWSPYNPDRSSALRECIAEAARQIDSNTKKIEKARQILEKATTMLAEGSA